MYKTGKQTQKKMPSEQLLKKSPTRTMDIVHINGRFEIVALSISYVGADV